MTYVIGFNAIASTGECTGILHFTIETIRPVELTDNQPMLEQMCIDFARSTGLDCSSANIFEATPKG